MSSHVRLEDGTLVPATPEPYWYRGLMTWFRWRPSCYQCHKIFATREEWGEHYVKYHSAEDK